MFAKILIANRGEIACRIARTANQMGIATVAVYSQADRRACHVEICDEAFYIGAAEASESYLNGTKILDIAQASGAQAIHPGYGFLSENADFARVCEARDIVFIGPPARAIELMGSKSGAKKLMQSAKVPLVPGYHGEDQSEAGLSSESERIGYPQLIKASSGGGGKGMRIVHKASEFAAALSSAKREAMAAFGDDKMLIEKYLPSTRHVEIQIFADSFGNVVHLFERDCSIQRRHQKILEEAPAPGMNEKLRQQMGKAAINCARAISYIGAGTVEFLLDQQGQFYFMEMNTRLQVEHPVTELITGLDLVEWQLQVAAGEELPLTQQQVRLDGHAFEARIYAEAPASDFLPCAGKLEYLHTPVCGPSVRIDSGVRQGDEIGVHYDPMIAKLIVHGKDRKSALARMQRALRDFHIMGLQTNIGFLASLVSNEAFARAEFDTGFIALHREQLLQNDSVPCNVVLLAGLFLVLTARQAMDHEKISPWQLNDGWRVNQPNGYKLNFAYDSRDLQLQVTAINDHWLIKWEEADYRVSGELVENRLIAEIDNQRYEVPLLQQQEGFSLWYDCQAWSFKRRNLSQDSLSIDQHSNELIAAMPGTVIALQVKAGDRVQSGDTLIVIEAMKMEHSMTATFDATVKAVYFQPGDRVEEGDRLITLE